MNNWNNNISALIRKYPSFQTDILDKFTPDPEAEVITAKNGLPSMRKGKTYLHSRHSPNIEAIRLIDQKFSEKPGVCIFYGFGLGYHVAAFHNKYPAVPIIVIEPDIPLFLSALKDGLDYSELFDKDVFSLALGTAPGTISSILEEFPFVEAQIVKLRSLYHLYEEYYQQCDAAVQAFFNRKQINLNTLKRFGKDWVRNLSKNISALAQSKPVSNTEKRISGIPACILSAGPTLDEALPVLKELAKRCVIIAVDTSYKACISTGVIPDFLIIVDPQYWNTRHLDWTDVQKTRLVSESSTHPRVFRLANEEQNYFCSSLFPLGKYLEDFIGERGKLGAGGSVSTTAWDFARLIGADPILFAGLDLGFPKKQTHARGSTFEERVHILSNRLVPCEYHGFLALYDASPFEEQDYSGNPILTDYRMRMYQQWFETQAVMYPETNTHPLSDKSLNIQGFSPLSINEALNFPENRDRINRILGELDESHIPRFQSKKLAKGISALITEISSIRRLAEEGEKLCRTIASEKDRGFAKEALTRLDAIDRQIMGKKSKEIISFLLQPLIQNVLSSSQEQDNLEVIMQTSEKIYKEIRESCEYHTKELKKAKLS
ncbi:MAG: motility associated factor glycosyltransferase family protein [Spirochaetia bacterium]